MASVLNFAQAGSITEVSTRGRRRLPPDDNGLYRVRLYDDEAEQGAK
jgi:hypothetical protein